MTEQPAPATDTFAVFGTTGVLVVTDPAALGRARAIADSELAAVDLACSRFRPDSELSMLNAADGALTPVSELFAQLIEEALRAAELTDGDVDPTCGGALVAAGYDRDFDELRAEVGRPAAAARDAAQPPLVSAAAAPGPVPGWRNVRLNRQRNVVQLARGAQLDLGSTAKAWAADRCAGLIAHAVGCGTLVSLGGDVAVAGPPPGDGWRVRATDDHRADADAAGQTVAIRAGGLATSSTTVRAWNSGGRAMHHIIDPRWRACPVPVAHRQRGRGLVRRREHRQHRRDHQGRCGARLAGRKRPASPPGQARWVSSGYCRVAGRPHGRYLIAI